jgi:FkbM family methyltransferase
MMKGLINRFFIKQPRLRLWVTRLLEGDRDLTVALLGARIRVNSIKEHGYLRASRFASRSSFFGDEAPVLMSLAFFLPRADAFVDVGSNVGVYCAILRKFRTVHPIPFYAFEANPDTYRRLGETVRPLDVATFDCALSEQDGHLDFVSGAVSHMFATVDNRSQYSLARPTVRVAARRLDSFELTGRRIALKVDVEGHEWQVLQGAERLFAENRIFLCYVDGFADARIPGFLRDRGFSLYDGRSLESRPAGDCYSLLAVREG